MKLLQRMAVAVLLLMTAGCSMVSIGYNNADWYLRYKINGYADFDREQRAEIHREVDAYLKWHRKAMLPEYADFMQRLQQISVSPAGLSGKDIVQTRDEIRRLIVASMQPAIAPSSHLLSQLSEAQVAELTVSFTEDIARLRKKELSGTSEEQLRERLDRIADFIEHFTGGLTDEQMGRLRDLNSNIPLATGILIRQRESNFEHLLQLLRRHATQDDLDKELGQWLNAPDRFRSREEHEVMHQFEHGMEDMIRQMYVQLNEKQMTRLGKKIAFYRDTFRNLAAQE